MCDVQGHTADRCGTDGKVHAISDSTRLRADGEDVKIVGMMSVRDSPQDSVKAIQKSSKGVSQTGSHVSDETVGIWQCLRLTVIVRDDIYDADGSKWEKSWITYGHGFTWYADSGAIRFMSNTRRGM